MPDPANYDNRDDWLEVCIPTAIDEGREQDQAVAMCMQMWRDRDKAVGAGTATTKAAAGLDRAYSLLTVKSIDADARVIKGMASTPKVDRVGDIVEPLGGRYALPLPLLLDHDHRSQVGHVEVLSPTKDGMPFVARIAKVDEPGAVKDLVDKAWHLVKHKLRAAVSIGFKPSEDGVEVMKSGGYRFKEWELLEISLVSVPAQAEAVIFEAKSLESAVHAVKSLDEKSLAASGRTTTSRDTRPGGSGTTVVTLDRKGRSTMAKKTIGEQIEGFEAARQAKSARMAALMDESSEKGETLDESQTEEYDGLEREVKALDDHLRRLQALERANVAAAKAVPEVKTVADGSAVRAGGSVRVTAGRSVPGVRFARVAKCIGASRGNLVAAAQMAEHHYGDDQGIVDVLKVAVAAGTTSNTTWAGNLVSDEGGVYADFVEWLRPQTIVGRFGNDGIPALRRVPFRTPLIGQSSGGDGYWVGDAAGKPLTKFDFTRTTLEPLKVANIAVVTEELLRDSSPSADVLVRDGLAAALRARLDTDFVDPNKTAVAGISPASITNGAPSVASGGTTADDVREDVRKLFAAFVALNNAPTTGVWIMPATTALALGMMTNALGQVEFPNVGMNGGSFAGLPVLTSEYVPSVGSPVSATVILANASDIYVGDEGGVSIDISREASLNMDTVPTVHAGGIGSPDAPTPSTLVSLWQTNAVGFRAERTINWAVRRTGAVQVLTGVSWGVA